MTSGDNKYKKNLESSKESIPVSGISSSFQELENAIKLSMTADEGREIFQLQNPKLSSTDLTQQKKHHRQQQRSNSFQGKGMYSKNLSAPFPNTSTEQTRAQLANFINESESRAIVLLHSPKASPLAIRNACSQFGTLHYIRPEFHGKGVTFVSYYDLRDAIAAYGSICEVIGLEADASAHYSIMLHTTNSNSKDFTLVIRNLPEGENGAQAVVEKVFARFGQLRSIQKSYDTSKVEPQTDTNVALSAYSVEYHSIQDARHAISELSATSDKIWGQGISIKLAPLEEQVQARCQQLLGILSVWRSEISMALSIPSQMNLMQQGRLVGMRDNGSQFAGVTSNFFSFSVPHSPVLGTLPVQQYDLSNMLAMNYGMNLYGGSMPALIDPNQQLPGVQEAGGKGTNNSGLGQMHWGMQPSPVVYGAPGMNPYDLAFSQNGPMMSVNRGQSSYGSHENLSFSEPSRQQAQPREGVSGGAKGKNKPQNKSRDNLLQAGAMTQQSPNRSAGRSGRGDGAHESGDAHDFFSHASSNSLNPNQSPTLSSSSAAHKSFMQQGPGPGSGPGQYQFYQQQHVEAMGTNTSNHPHQNGHGHKSGGAPHHHNGGHIVTASAFPSKPSAQPSIEQQNLHQVMQSRSPHTAYTGLQHFPLHRQMSPAERVTPVGRQHRAYDKYYGIRSSTDHRSSQRDSGFVLDVGKIGDEKETRTTVMVRNIPNKYNKLMLLEEVNLNHEGTYDFFYLPIDFKNRCNVGYCFINFLEPSCIPPFVQEFNGKRWKSFNSEKVCAVSFARIQGKNAMISRFQKSSLLEKDEACTPLLFYSDGENLGKVEAFPVSTKKNYHNTGMRGTKQDSASLSSSLEAYSGSDSMRRDSGDSGGNGNEQVREQKLCQSVERDQNGKRTDGLGTEVVSIDEQPSAAGSTPIADNGPAAAITG